MIIVKRNIVRDLVSSSLLILYILVAIFSLFKLIDELENVGIGNFEFNSLLTYLLYLLPSIAYTVLPLSILMGSFMALGKMSQNNELIVIQTSGFSNVELKSFIFFSVLAITFFAVIISETFSWTFYQKAKSFKHLAMHSSPQFESKNEFWFIKDNQIVNIKENIAGEVFKGISIFEISKNNELIKTIFSKDGYIEENNIFLNDALLINLQKSGNSYNPQQFREKNIKSKLYFNNDGEISLKKPPNDLSFMGLINQIIFLSDHGLNYKKYTIELLQRIFLPINVTIAILICIPLFLRHSRNISIGRRAFFAIILGLILNLLTKFSSLVSLRFDTNVLLVNIAPTITLIFFAIYFSRKNTVYG